MWGIWGLFKKGCKESSLVLPETSLQYVWTGFSHRAPLCHPECSGEKPLPCLSHLTGMILRPTTCAKESATGREDGEGDPEELETLSGSVGAKGHQEPQRHEKPIAVQLAPAHRDTSSQMQVAASAAPEAYLFHPNGQTPCDFWEK